MNENKINQNSDFATGFLTTRQMLSARLRDMSYHVSDMDKCTLCKAANELDKVPEKSNSDWALPLLSLMLFSGFGNIDLDGMKAYFEATEKKMKENAGKDG